MSNIAIHRTWNSLLLGWVVLMVACLLPVSSFATDTPAYAGVTVADATVVTDTTELLVRDGANYMKLESEHLPATFVYVPDSAFGPLPVLQVMGDTVPASAVFSGCRMSWVWEVTRQDESSFLLVSVVAHEDATVQVLPLVCPESETTFVEAWDSLEWKNAVYTESGTYSETFTTESGCVYSKTLELTIHKTLRDTTPMTVCDNVVIGSVTYTESGYYILDTVPLASGDRQVNVLFLTVNRSTTGEITASAFDTFTSPSGQTYTESGDYTETLTNAAGCDSTLTLHLTIHATTYDTIRATVCERYEYNNRAYTTSGSYNDTTLMANGDRLVTTLELLIKQASSSVQYITRCDSYTSPQGHIYTLSGDYFETLTNAIGCDSVITLHITISHASSQEITASVFDSFTSPSGQTYTESGDYTETLSNAVGCDSVVTYHLTIHSTTYDTIRAAACEQYEYNNRTYTASGNYNDTTFLANGDRQVTTLMLTIHHASSSEQYIAGCDSYTSPSGQIYTQSGDYTETLTNAAGCDSTVTLHLTIAHASFGALSANACVSFRAPSGTIYTESGIYADTTTNVAGCDSIITLTLTIEPDCFEYDTVYFCRGLNTQHEELVSEGLVRRYEPYTFESPAAWDYAEGLIVLSESDRTLVDMHHAEANLHEHYVGGLEPIIEINWGLRATGSADYQTLTAGTEPQWIESGMLTMQVIFLCGHTYRSDFRMGTDGVEQTETSATPVKMIKDGRVIIIRGNAVYTPLGQKIQ